MMLFAKEDSRVSAAGSSLRQVLQMANVDVVFLGRGNCGKTSLNRVLLGQEFQDNSASTLGLDVSTTEPGFLSLNNTRVKLWDFAGQELTHPVHRLFFKPNSLFVIVVQANGEDPFQASLDAHYWLRLVQQNSTDGEPPKVIIVKNKSQKPGLRPAKIDFYTYQQKFPGLIAEVATDCKTGLGIEELKGIFAAQVNDTSVKVDPEFLEAKVRLERISFLSKEELSTTLTSCKIDRENQDLAIKYLIDSGTLVSLNLDGNQSSYFANPIWLSRGLYSILRLGESSEGQIFLNSECEVLKDFDENDRRFLFRVLESLELGYASRQNQDKFIVPISVLPYAGAEVWDKFQPIETSHLDVKAPVYDDKITIVVQLDKAFAQGLGLLPRIIARNSNMIKDQNVWNGSCVIDLGEAAGFLQLNDCGKEFQLTIVGGDKRERAELAKHCYQELVAVLGDLEYKPKLHSKEGWINIASAIIDKSKGSLTGLDPSYTRSNKIDPGLDLARIGLA